jgi:hypothetical protein
MYSFAMIFLPGITAALHSVLGGRVVKAVHLHADGTKIDISYRGLPFWTRTTTLNIGDLA